METASPISIRLISLDDVDEVATLFSTTITKETLTKHFKLSPSDIHPVALALTLSSIPLSFVCEDASRPIGDRIVGFRLAHHFNPSSPLTTLPPFNSYAPFYAISHFSRKFASINKNQLSNCRVAHLLGLGIREGYEGKGIAGEMIQATVEHAQSVGYDKIIVETVGGNNQKIFEKLQFKKSLDLPLSDVEIGGKRVLSDIKGRGILYVAELKSGSNDVHLHSNL